MSAAEELMGDNGIAYASNNAIFGWHAGMKRPYLIKHIDHTVFPVMRNTHITSLGYFEGSLFCSGYTGKIRDVKSGEMFGTQKKNPIYRFIGFNGRLAAVAEQKVGEQVVGGELHDIKGARVYYADDESVIAQFGPVKGDAGWEFPGEPLSHRPTSLELASSGDTLYLASENVLSIRPNGNGEPEVSKLTDYLSDFVLLPSNGQRTFAVFAHNSHTNPDGGEIRDLPSNRRIGYWKPDDGYLKNLPGEPSFGYERMATIAGNTLIMGMVQYKHPGKGHGIYGIPITDGMRESENGILVRPQLLIPDAFVDPDMFGGMGNPITSLPRDALENLL